MRSFAQITQHQSLDHSQPMDSCLNLSHKQLNTFVRLRHWLSEEHASLQLETYQVLCTLILIRTETTHLNSNGQSVGKHAGNHSNPTSKIYPELNRYQHSASGAGTSIASISGGGFQSLQYLEAAQQSQFVREHSPLTRNRIVKDQYSRAKPKNKVPQHWTRKTRRP